MSCQALNKTSIKKFFDSFDNVLTDCDGVLWHGNNAIEGSVETVNELQKMGKKVFYVTNNSTQTRQEFGKKFQQLGFEAKIENIFCTSTAVANYLKSLNFNKKVYVIGSPGITGELDTVGIPHIGLGPDPLTSRLVDWVRGGIALDSEVGAVVVGFDPHFNYVKLLKAASYLNQKDCLFVASNMDAQFPVESSTIVVPGTGALVEAVKTAAGRDPVILGKPEKGFFDAIAYQHKIDPKRTLMVGDRLNTDILFGNLCGLHTLFVETGVSTMEEVETLQKSSSEEDRKMVPNYNVKHLGSILEFLKEAGN